MQTLRRLAPAVVVIALVACGREELHEGEGDLLALDAGAATIAHEAIPGLLEAATTRFEAVPASALDGARVGSRVSFALRRERGSLILTRIALVGPARGPAPGTVDPGPRHGGVVSATGGLQVEVSADRDGRVRVYLRDAWGRPMVVEGVTGTVTLRLPSGDRAVVLGPLGEALEGRGGPIAEDSTLATVALVRRGEPLETTVLLDLTGVRAGAPGVPQSGCIPPARAATGGRSPRCTIRFAQTFTAIGTSRDGARAIVAVSHGSTTVWRLPEARLVMGLDPGPPEPHPHGAHAPDARAIAVRSDGAEAAVAMGDHVAFFDAATGRFRRRVEGPGGAVVAAAWQPDGTRLAVAAAGDGKAHLLDAADGRVVRTIAADGQALTVAIDAAGRFVAVATDTGTIAVAALGTDAPPRVLSPSLEPVQALAFAGERLVSAGRDGHVRVVEPASATEVARLDLGTPLLGLAVTADGRLAALAGHDRTIHVVRLPDLAPVEHLAWHRATIGALAFGAGGTLVSGDNDGELAVWDVRGGAE